MLNFLHIQRLGDLAAAQVALVRFIVNPSLAITVTQQAGGKCGSWAKEAFGAQLAITVTQPAV